MKTFARIFENVALEVVQANTLDGKFHPSVVLLFTEVPNIVKQGSKRVNGIWTEPPKPTLNKEAEKKNARKAWIKILETEYDSVEVLHMTLAYQAGKPKASAVYAWMMQGFDKVMLVYYPQIEAGTVPAYDFSEIGNAPYKYDEVVAEFVQ